MAVYSAWALISYGYTISMLVALAEADKSLTIEVWSRYYGDGKGLDAMQLDRLRLLAGMRLIVKEMESVRLFGSGAKFFAGVLRFSMRLVPGSERSQ
jgi:hypothetical protein